MWKRSAREAAKRLKSGAAAMRPMPKPSTEERGARANQGNSERVSDMTPMQQTPGERRQSEEAPEVA